MNDDKPVREHLRNLLKNRQAHVHFERVLADFPLDLRGRRPEGIPYSAWELLEYLRIAQWDILEFSRDSQHLSPEFPKGYWPPSRPTSRPWRIW
jgi:hypothetical protein